MTLRSLFYDLLTLQGIIRHSRPWCGPRIAQINISDNCNLDCTICNHACMGVSGLLDAGKVMSLVDELYRMGTQEVFYHGFGEPGLHPRLPDMIDHCRKETPHLRQHLITNGTWDSPRLLEAIGVGQVRVRFSLHAGDADTWCLIHPHDDPDFFRQAGENLLQLTNAAPKRVEVLYVICKSNCRKIDEMVAYAADHGVRRILFRPMRLFRDRSGNYMNAHLLPDAEEFQEAAVAVARFRQKLRGRMTILSVPFEQNSFDEEQGRPSSRAFFLCRSCYIGYVLTVIERDGGVWGCLPESSDGLPLGNIHENSFREIWNGPAYEQFRRRQLFLDKSALNPTGCSSYCQHLDTNIRLNRIRFWKKHDRFPCAGAPE
jgi:MoaA/NifB/PqqE/SkfB family radical SAM enzyme